jgi:hypothetical protein
MANRLVFLPTSPTQPKLYSERLVSFQWIPGMAISQGRKSVINLHSSATEQLGISKILEISTRSQDELGVRLSAFNLPILIEGRRVSVEVAYQSSKVFKFGGPFTDLLEGSSMEAKQDLRIKTSGPLIGFRFEGREWPLSSNPNFYDYLYIRALLAYPDSEQLRNYEAFTDIVFSQSTLKPRGKKSFNCQARSAAIYCSLFQRMSKEELVPFLQEESAQAISNSDQLDLF